MHDDSVIAVEDAGAERAQEVPDQDQSQKSACQQQSSADEDLHAE